MLMFLDVGAGKCISTGLWGCGIFGGNYVLKFIQQIMASSATQTKLCFSTFGSADIENELQHLLGEIQSSKVTVGELFTILCSFSKTKNNHQNKLTDHIIRNLHEKKKNV